MRGGSRRLKIKEGAFQDRAEVYEGMVYYLAVTFMRFNLWKAACLKMDYGISVGSRATDIELSMENSIWTSTVVLLQDMLVL